jgi:thiopeptide-type bacteriocin biosynthesis protein
VRWVADGFFVMRTPMLPADVLHGLSEGLEAAACWRGGDRRALEIAVGRDRERVRDRLLALSHRPELREALFLASPSLEQALAEWRRDPASKRGEKLERSLLRYVSRMAGRPTPFGLFAGCSIGYVGSRAAGRSSLRLQPRGAYRRHAQIDVDRLESIGTALERDPTVRQHLTYVPNSSLYRASGQLRYVEARASPRGKTHHLVALEPTQHLEAALACAVGGARPDVLAAAVCACDPHIALDEAREFVDALIADEVLVSQSAPLELIERQRDLPADVGGWLSNVRSALADLCNAAPGAGMAPYRRIADALCELGAVDHPARLLHVDLHKPVAEARLGPDVIAEIIRSVGLLHRISGARRVDPLAGFRKSFRSRYGHREDVPLCEALDEEMGVGFPAGNWCAMAPAPLLDGLPFVPAAEGTSPSFDARDALLLGWLDDARRAGTRELVLGDEEVDALAAAGGGQTELPDALSVTATILAADEDAVAHGRYRVHVIAARGPSGATLLGRFCLADERLTELVRAHARAEEALRPDAVFAEIVHAPDGRIGNVLRRPSLRSHEIPYLGRSTVPRDRQISVSDLIVSIVDDRVVLRSGRLGREVVPRLTAAHNFASPRNLAIYRFLCALQAQQLGSGLAFSFGSLESAPDLPRVTCGRLVLSRARWNLGRGQLAGCDQPRESDRFAATQALRQELGLPRWVAIADADNLLPIDLDNAASVDVAAHLLKRRTNATLVELFCEQREIFARGPEGRFVHELIVPLVRSRTGSPPAYAARSRTVTRSQRSRAPGSDWLFAKLSTGVVSADSILRDIVRPVVGRALSSGWADSWHFVRYADPQWHIRLRVHGDPKALLAEALPGLLDAAAPLVSAGRLWRIELDTYEREIERYGGVTGMALAERVFHADSEAALDVVASTGGDQGGDTRWRLALLGTDWLLDDLGLRLDEKRATMHAARTYLGLQLRVGPTLRRRIGDRYRTERVSLEALLGERAAAPPAFKRRSRALRPIAGELRAADRRGELWRPLEELAGSFIHMHANRVLTASSQAEELVIAEFLCRHYEGRLAREGR